MRVIAIIIVAGASIAMSPALFAATDGADKPVAGEVTRQGVVVNKIVVNRRNIFDRPNSQTNPRPEQVLIESTINRLHKITLESVILREAGVEAGDTLGPADVNDVERRLRQLGIFATVSAKLVTTNDGVELHIDTRDNFSIVAGASGSYLGGIGDLGFQIGDKNLFGTGNNLRFELSRSTTDNYRGSLIFRDLHFFQKPWRARYRVGRTDEGDFYGMTLDDPYRSLDDTRAWSMTADRTERFIKYYQDGDIVVQLPQDEAVVSGSYFWRKGSPKQYLKTGLIGTLRQNDYGQIAGVAADTINVPEDNRSFYLGGLLGRDTVSSFVKAQGIDTLTFVQDLTLGSIAELQFGFNVIEEDESDRTEPQIALALSHSFVSNNNTFLKFGLRANTVFEEAGATPWSATADMKAYYTGFSNNTLAARIEYSTGEDGAELPVQLTLGENNGLRGYDARQFQGRQRGRINLESRYHTGRKLSVFDIGLVGFVDAGWAAERDDSSPAIKSSVGVGLRLGSSALLGPLVIRMDAAVPLDPPDGEDSNPRLSFAVGQVFRF